MKMNYLLKAVFLTIGFVGALVQTSECYAGEVDHAQLAGQALGSKDYAAASAHAASGLAKDKHNVQLLSLAGDAAFMQGDPQAHSYYARAWLEEFDDAWDATKGSSPIWKVLAVSVAVLGVAADYTNAQQGISSSMAADGLASSTKMLASLEETTGDKNNRKNVKRVMGDLQKLIKRGSTSFQIIKPGWTTVAGGGMARVLGANGICNAMRVGQGNYAVSAACLRKVGDPKGVSIDTSIRPEDFAPVIAQRVNTDWVQLSVQPGKTKVYNVDGGPAAWNGSAAEAYGVTWWASEFDYIVPVFSECSTDRFDDCGDNAANDAILWVKQQGQWHFYGFVNDSGSPVRLAAL